jgi:hypothetical protein
MDGRMDRQTDRLRNLSGVGWVTYRFFQVNLVWASLTRSSR